MESRSRYQLLDPLGAGAMGVVYRALQEPLRRLVALKFVAADIAADPVALDRFRREILACTRLSHPGVVKIFDFGEIDGKPFYAMELIEGATPLDDLLSDQGRLPVDRAASIALQLLEALRHVHAANLVHRDVKAANLMVLDDGRAILMDFGLVKDVDRRTILTAPGVSLGSPAYMSPESWHGDPAGPGNDVWGAGVLLYEMLAGHRPFGGSTLTELVNGVTKQEPVPIRDARPEVPREVADALAVLLLKDPIERMRGAAGAAEALRGWLDAAGCATSMQLVAGAGGEKGAEVTRPAKARGTANARSGADARGAADARGVKAPGAADAREERGTRGVAAPVARGANGEPRGAPAALLAARRAATAACLMVIVLSAIGLAMRPRGAWISTVHGPPSDAGASPSGAAAAPPEQVDDVVTRVARLRGRLDVVDAGALVRALADEVRAVQRERDAGQRAQRLGWLKSGWTARVSHAVKQSRLEEAVDVFGGALDTAYCDPRVSAEAKLDLFRRRAEWVELEALGAVLGLSFPAIAPRLHSEAFGQVASPRLNAQRGRGALMGEGDPVEPPPGGPGFTIAPPGNLQRRLRAVSDPKTPALAAFGQISPPFHTFAEPLWRPVSGESPAAEIIVMAGNPTASKGVRVLMSTVPDAPRNRWTLLAELAFRVYGYQKLCHSIPAGVLPRQPTYLRVEVDYDLTLPLGQNKKLIQELYVAWLVLAY